MVLFTFLLLQINTPTIFFLLRSVSLRPSNACSFQHFKIILIQRHINWHLFCLITCFGFCSTSFFFSLLVILLSSWALITKYSQVKCLNFTDELFCLLILFFCFFYWFLFCFLSLDYILIAIKFNKLSRCIIVFFRWSFCFNIYFFTVLFVFFSNTYYSLAFFLFCFGLIFLTNRKSGLFCLFLSGLFMHCW